MVGHAEAAKQLAGTQYRLSLLLPPVSLAQHRAQESRSSMVLHANQQILQYRQFRELARKLKGASETSACPSVRGLASDVVPIEHYRPAHRAVRSGNNAERR